MSGRSSMARLLRRRAALGLAAAATLAAVPASALATDYARILNSSSQTLTYLSPPVAGGSCLSVTRLAANIAPDGTGELSELAAPWCGDEWYYTFYALTSPTQQVLTFGSYDPELGDQIVTCDLVAYPTPGVVATLQGTTCVIANASHSVPTARIASTGAHVLGGRATVMVELYSRRHARTARVLLTLTDRQGRQRGRLHAVVAVNRPVALTVPLDAATRTALSGWRSHLVLRATLRTLGGGRGTGDAHALTLFTGPGAPR